MILFQRLFRGTSTPSSTTALDMSKIGLFFRTSTGSTAGVADMIVEEFGTNNIEIDGLFMWLMNRC